MHPHFGIADLVKGIAIAMPCIALIWLIVSGLLAWRNRFGPPRPDPMDEAYGDFPHWPKERQ